VLSFFSRKRSQSLPVLPVDMHSHLLPGIDDGARTNEESIALIDEFLELGYKKIITTPHIMTDYYGNTAETITAVYNQFTSFLKERGYTVPFQCAAEYYFDEKVYSLVVNKSPLMTFGKNFFLFETNVISEPLQLHDFIFSLTSQGYRPVMAHPERYQYMTLEKAEDLRYRGVLLQINLLSLVGFYGPPIQRFAEKLIDRGWVDLVGTDCHNMEQIYWLKKVQRARSYRKVLDLPLLNYSL
jgi:protein-tyrosine phosphatase